MTEPIPPWCDSPACPACTAPCGTRDGEAIPDGHLRCACCGLDWLAMPGETAQALASDAAWELEQQRPALTPDNPT